MVRLIQNIIKICLLPAAIPCMVVCASFTCDHKGGNFCSDLKLMWDAYWWLGRKK